MLIKDPHKIGVHRMRDRGADHICGDCQEEQRVTRTINPIVIRLSWASSGITYLLFKTTLNINKEANLSSFKIIVNGRENPIKRIYLYDLQMIYLVYDVVINSRDTLSVSYSQQGNNGDIEWKDGGKVPNFNVVLRNVTVD